MVCISCFIAPVVIWLWFTFVQPLVQPIVNRIWGNYQLQAPFADLTCPIKKRPNQTGDLNEESNGTEEQKVCSEDDEGDKKKNN